MPSIPPASQSSQVPDGMGPDPSAVGTLFVANLVLFLLFGVISVQMYLYHLTSSIDRGVVRATVYGIYALLFVQLVMCGRDGYVRFSSLSQNGIGLGWFFVPVIGGIVGFGVQMFYAWRIYILSQRRPIPAFLLALSATSAIAAFASAGYGSKVGTVQSLGDSSGIRISTAIWYSTSAFCDLVIAGYMIYLLTRGGSVIENTRSVVGKVVRLIIETNALTATLAVITVALLLGLKNQTYYTVFSLILPNIYGNTLLVMMNLRYRFSRGLGSPSGNADSSLGTSLTSYPAGALPECTHCNRRFVATQTDTFMSSLDSSTRCADSPYSANKNAQGYNFQYRVQDLHN